MSLRRIPGARPVPAGRAVRAALSTTPQAGPAAPASAPAGGIPGGGPARAAGHPPPAPVGALGRPRSAPAARPGAVGGHEHRQALPERLRKRLLLGGREVDAAVATQLRLRLLRPGRPDHDRQAPARTLAAGGLGQDLRLLPRQPAAPGGDRGGPLRGGTLLGHGQALRTRRGPRGRPDVGDLPLLRCRLPGQHPRCPAGLPADPRLRASACARARAAASGRSWALP